MPVPKKKTSKSRRDRRRAHDKLAFPHATRTCPQCGEPSAMHRVCASCGFYQGKEVVHIPIE
ncbi:MAG: 50S ribosomal protein L32 [Bdellovibrionales bacterium]|nr:50S ribosomal protein L32 [Bdellovibrionales bacterium]